ncbi:hypothetical protein IW146_000949 [Coemansia sp. RSA 922]|nr:hypothetical protein IW146_000949 [Coemansia sp. RSA 922]
MHSRTPFQFLEPHIVRLIVDNVVDSGDEERLKSLLHLILRRRARREGSYVSNLPLPVFEDAMPFPILRRLKIPFMYPVGNDIFFRGNAATLEYLSIKLNRDIVVMLREHSVFTSRSHSSLRRVNVEYDDSSEPGELASNAEALQFVLSIGTRASVRGIAQRCNSG